MECKINDCNGKVFCRGLCQKHYRRVWRSEKAKAKETNDILDAKLQVAVKKEVEKQVEKQVGPLLEEIEELKELLNQLLENNKS